jgi:AraC-like DNA-binding protein
VTLLGLRELVSDLGGDLEAYAREVGIDLTVTRAPDLFLSSRKVHELVNVAAERLKRKDLGLLWGARSDPARLGPLHVALVNAASGREALELIVRFLHINFPTGSVTLRPMAGGQREFIGVRSALPRPPSLIQFYERRVGSLHVLLKTVCGPAYRPDEVWFTHERQSSFAAYQNVFGIRPSFAMPENGIVVSRRVLDAARPATNSQVREMAVSFLKTHAPPADTSMTSEARYMVGILMRSSNCTSSQSARALGMHPRTLQRRLQKENASFEAIKDEVRRNMASEMLADPSMPLTSIAHHLHYANLSAFSRRCRTWFGKPPTLVRRGLLRRSKALHRPQIRRDL